jgi:2-amino-4-hydroxy-6-hydroxymethyldihydropteridine diphosphokinase
MLTEVYLGLGSNLGNRTRNLLRAVDALRDLSTGVEVSHFYETSPQGFGGQPAFVNAACRIWTWLDPFELLEKIGEIHAKIGTRRAFVNGPRAIDLDILVFGRWVIDSPALTIPHPRLAEREFVLRPLADIAPGLEHPVLHETVGAMLARLVAVGRVAPMRLRGQFRRAPGVAEVLDRTRETP